jgi:diaminohydroxyphosphoribosylaminopyrimidine deaminase/5-amino-6-(5-phosphoribosylamino)uracil reductase
MKKYEKYMKKCLKLALKADGMTSPNPLVGCVVLDKNGKEISTGYHKKYGEAHAERDALLKLTNDEAHGGTLIVNLEPCNHYGKTPPCADLIIEKGIKTLVVGMKDPNPNVEGGGCEKCRKAGIKVIENVLEVESQELNEIFIKNMKNKAIFVAIKTATTLDGKIATKTGDSKWITSEKARTEVQKIRNRYDAILTTSATILADNPSMTCRMKNGKNPARIVLDRTLKTDFSSKIFNEDGTKIFLVIDENTDGEKISRIPSHIKIIKCPTKDKKLNLSFIFEKIFEYGMRSVLVESGGKLNGELISQNLVDKIYHFVAPKVLGDENGVNAFVGRNIEKINDSINFDICKIEKFSPDMLIIYKPYNN